MAVDLEEILNSQSRLWVFGYGSILWKTGFRYKSRRTGYINGYMRRFWQGNTTHRGTPESPGRVATLIESQDQNSRVWGMAYELVGCQMILQALEHLGVRECTLGGYSYMLLSFYCAAGGQCREDCNQCLDCDKCSSDCDTCNSQYLPVLVFTATPENDLFLGPASNEDMANQIVSSKGNAGHNVEYVLRTAEYIRQNIKDDQDEHLFGLEKQIRALLHERNICVECLIHGHSKGKKVQDHYQQSFQEDRQRTVQRKDKFLPSKVLQMPSVYCIKCTTN